MRSFFIIAGLSLGVALGYCLGWELGYEAGLEVGDFLRVSARQRLSWESNLPGELQAMGGGE